MRRPGQHSALFLPETGPGFGACCSGAFFIQRPSAAARHSRYWPATSTSLAVVAPKLGSVSGVSSGQEATTSGVGPAGERGIEALQLLRRMHAVAVDSLFANLTLHLVLDGGVLDLDAGDGLGRGVIRRLGSALLDRALARLARDLAVLAEADAVPAAGRPGDGHREERIGVQASPSV